VTRFYIVALDVCGSSGWNELYATRVSGGWDFEMASRFL